MITNIFVAVMLIIVLLTLKNMRVRVDSMSNNCIIAIKNRRDNHNMIVLLIKAMLRLAEHIGYININKRNVAITK